MAAAGAYTVMVVARILLSPPSARIDGLNAQDVFAGRPEHEKEMAPMTPPSGVTVNTALPD
jgi:hypothetical protein